MGDAGIEAVVFTAAHSHGLHEALGCGQVEMTLWAGMCRSTHARWKEKYEDIRKDPTIRLH